MAGLYVDTSAVGRVLLDEPDAGAILDVIGLYEVRWSSALLVVELRRLGVKAGLADAAEEVLGTVRLLDLDMAAVERASRIEPVKVRSLDAIHLDAAVVLARRGDVDAVLTYDRQLQAGCVHHGLAVEAPSIA
ncbi:Ribonuclease VapC47 [Paraconexibacter sp. AEG42_29]|uniref:Ribonuclease VapC47 n=1 Tax=Paraconexibacter sp. AEG42_29 TaxID=2997339 RepID=A0AAU7AP79_9ACTN